MRNDAGQQRHNTSGWRSRADLECREKEKSRQFGRFEWFFHSKYFYEFPQNQMPQWNMRNFHRNKQKRANIIFYFDYPHEQNKTDNDPGELIKSKNLNIFLKAGVPVIQGYNGPDQSAENLLMEAKKLGFPVMMKAVCGVSLKKF